jgi:hypothetical protein
MASGGGREALRRNEPERAGAGRGLVAQLREKFVDAASLEGCWLTCSALHRCGIPTALAEVDENNETALALFESAGARRASSSLELVRR